MGESGNKGEWASVGELSAKEMGRKQTGGGGKGERKKDTVLQTRLLRMRTGERGDLRPGAWNSA